MSVKDAPFNAVGDGVADDTAAIQAAITAIGSGDELQFPHGTYKITAEIDLFNVNRVRLLGKGTVNIVWSVLSDATKACVKLKWASFCEIENIQVSALDGTHKPGFGFYVTSEGAGGPNTTQSNTFTDCSATSCSVTGLQIGKHGVDGDVNVDENKLLNCSATTCGTGIEISGSNTNNTTVRGGYAIGCTSYGLQIAFGARGVIIDDFLPANNGNYHFKVLKSISGSISLRNITAELAVADNCMLLQVDPISGGTPTFPLLTMENVNCTVNAGAVAGSKIIDYQGSGSVTMRNCRFGGGVAFTGGAGCKLSFRPLNSLTSGDTWLITENVSLYDGAVWDVITDIGSVYFRWLEIGTATSGSGVLTDTPTIGGIILHEGAPFQVRNLLALTPAAGITVNSNGYLGRQTYKITIDKAAWTAAAVQQDLTLCTLPAKTRIVGCYADTTIAYAGLAGTIQLNVYVTAAGDILVQHDVKTAAVVKGLLDADMGTGMTRAAQIQGAFIGTNGWTANLQPIARLVSSVGNLGNGSVTNLTTGSTTVYIITETQP